MGSETQWSRQEMRRSVFAAKARSSMAMSSFEGPDDLGRVQSSAEMNFKFRSDENRTSAAAQGSWLHCQEAVQAGAPVTREGNVDSRSRFWFSSRGYIWAVNKGIDGHHNAKSCLSTTDSERRFRHAKRHRCVVCESCDASEGTIGMVRSWSEWQGRD